jgi:hypothetical protein
MYRHLDQTHIKHKDYKWLWRLCQDKARGTNGCHIFAVWPCHTVCIRVLVQCVISGPRPYGRCGSGAVAVAVVGAVGVVE